LVLYVDSMDSHILDLGAKDRAWREKLDTSGYGCGLNTDADNGATFESWDDNNDPSIASAST
jgi:hypothetical protein